MVLAGAEQELPLLDEASMVQGATVSPNPFYFCIVPVGTWICYPCIERSQLFIKNREFYLSHAQVLSIVKQFEADFPPS